MTRRITVRSGSVPRKVAPPASAAAFDGSEITSGTVTATELADDYVNVDGDAMTGPLAMGANKITGVADPTSAQDAATKAYVDAVWIDWSPTYTNLTIGNGTVTARYIQVGKLIVAWFEFVLGSTSAVGTVPKISFPVTASSGYPIDDNFIGNARFEDANPVKLTLGYVALTSTTTFAPVVMDSSGSQVKPANVSATVPHSWASGDNMFMSITYEAA